METFRLDSIAPEIAAGLCSRRIALAGFRDAKADSMARVLNSVGVLSQRVTLPRLEREAAHFDGILYQVEITGPDAGALLSGLAAPVLVLGRSEDLLAGMAGAYDWADGFLADSWSNERLLLAVFRLLYPPRPKNRPVIARSRRPLILLADDDWALTSLMEAVLGNHGMETRTVRNGLAAMSAIREQLPDVAVLDVNMPMMSGLEVLAAARGDPSLAKLPIAMLTGCDDSVHVGEGARLGADDYIVKPIQPMQFVPRIKKLLLRSHAYHDAGEPAAPDTASPLAEATPVREQRADYLRRRRSELIALRAAIVAGDYETIRTIGHDLKASGAAYDFPKLSELGHAIEMAALARSSPSLLGVSQDLGRHLWITERGFKE